MISGLTFILAVCFAFVIGFLVGGWAEYRELVDMATDYGWVIIWPDGTRKVPPATRTDAELRVLRPERVPPQRRN